MVKVFFYIVGILLSVSSTSIIKNCEEHVDKEREKKLKRTYYKRHGLKARDFAYLFPLLQDARFSVYINKKHKKLENIPKKPSFKSLIWDYPTAYHTKEIDTKKKFLEQYLPKELIFEIIKAYKPRYSPTTRINDKDILYRCNAPKVIPQTVKLIPLVQGKEIKQVLLSLYIDNQSYERGRYIQTNANLCNQFIQSKLKKNELEELEESKFLDGIPYTHAIVGVNKNKSTFTIGYIFCNAKGVFCHTNTMFRPFSPLNLLKEEKMSTYSFFSKDVVPLSKNKLIVSTERSIFIFDITSIVQMLYRSQYTKNSAVLAPMKNWQMSLPQYLVRGGFKKLFAITDKTFIGLSYDGIIYTVAIDGLSNSHCYSKNREVLESGRYFFKQTLQNISFIKDLNKDPEDATRLIALSKAGDICFLSLHNRTLIKLCNVPSAKRVWIDANLIMIKQHKNYTQGNELCFLDGDALLSKRSSSKAK